MSAVVIEAAPLMVERQQIPAGESGSKSDSLFVQIFRGELEIIATTVYRGFESQSFETLLPHEEATRVRAVIALAWLKWPDTTLGSLPEVTSTKALIDDLQTLLEKAA